MSHGHAECTSCGHSWDLRKAHTEIERLRCSACGTTGGAITVRATATDPVAPDELPIAKRLRIEERQTELQTRADRILDDIEQLGDGSVPDNLAPTYTALETLTTELDADELVAADQLDAIRAYLIEKEEDIYTRETVSKVTNLEQRIEELQAEIEQLEAEKEQLKRYLRYGRSLTDGE